MRGALMDHTVTINGWDRNPSNQCILWSTRVPRHHQQLVCYQSVTFQLHSPLPGTRVRVLIHGAKHLLRRFMVRSLILYGTKHHNIALLDPNIFNTLNLFLYIKKTNFPYLTNVRQNPHTKNEHFKGKEAILNILKISNRPFFYLKLRVNLNTVRLLIHENWLKLWSCRFKYW